MKKFLLIFITSTILVVSNFYAQTSDRITHLPNFDKPVLRYGFYLGMNTNDYKINYTKKDFNINVAATSGFNVGLIADLRLHKNISLRLEPGLVTNTKVLTFTHINTGVNDSNREISSAYLHVPFLFKFSTNRLDNIRPYVLGGLTYDYNFSSNQDNADDNSSGEFRTKTHNLMYEIGLGVDFYFDFFKFSPSIRGVFAINNELVYDADTNSQWTGGIDYFGTRGVFINFSFH